MKTLAIASRARSFVIAFALGCSALATGSVAATSAAAASGDACSDKCLKDWPRTIAHAVPRKTCEAKCAAYGMAAGAKAKVTAAWRDTKEVAGAVVDKAKELGGKVVHAVAHLARGVWDSAKNCIADGLGACARKIVTAAANLARGLYDKVKDCVADGLGGCLKKIVKAIAEVACKGIGIFYDPATKCCAAKGALQCAKDAAVAVVKKGAQWLCDHFASAAAPKLNQGAAWLINKAGAALANYKISLRGSEIGSLACAFKSALGRTVQALSKKFGDPYLTISDIKISAAPAGTTINAHLGATASLSVPGQEGALTLSLLGEVDAAINTTCNFQGPLVTFGAHISDVKISSIPQWLTNAAVAGFVNPSLGCMSFCPKPIQAAGMNVKLDYCKVIDACLRSNCTAPVLNTVL